MSGHGGALHALGGTDAHGGHGGHGHGGHGSGASAPTRVLAISVALTFAFMLVEAAAGVVTGALALLADAAHMLADAGALGLALVASRWAQRPRTAVSTFGHRRAEVLAAFVNGIALAVTALFIVVEAASRWQAPRVIDAGWMFAVAALGLGVNLAVAAILSRASQDSVNVRVAALHVAADAIGSVGAMLAAGLVLAFGWNRADAVIAVVIAGLVAWSGWRVLRETTGILLEGAPPHLNVGAVEKAIREIGGVAGVHDLHVWRISDRFDTLTVHVTLAPGTHGVEVCREVAACLRNRFGLEHVTVQPEAPPPELVSLRRSKDGDRVGAKGRQSA